MRGAQPDAECPRCHHRQPPVEGALATCLKCGLSYPPKELQHRTKKPTLSRPSTDAGFALELPQPDELEVDETEHELTFRWSDHPGRGLLAVAVAVIVGALLWSSEIVLRDKMFHSVVLAGLAYFGVYHSRKTAQVTLDQNQLTTANGTLLLADIERIDVEGNRVLARIRYDKTALIIAPRDPRVAAFVGERLFRRIRRDE